MIKWTHGILFLVLTFALFVEGRGQLMNELMAVLKDHTLTEASWAMTQLPVTVTSSICRRSAGGKHDFYSEADYWWPDPQNPGGAYVQRDGMTNPHNFVDHRKAMIRLSRIIGSLSSAYIISGDESYATHAFTHLKAWFVDTATMMNPSLLYAQAIQGRVTGRGIGIIDTIHLMEVAQGVRVMESCSKVDKRVLNAVKIWFNQYLRWLMDHPYGKQEMNAANNHGTCWVMQVAAFARVTGQDSVLQFCRDRYKQVLIPNQMARDGSFPLELKRTKPYGYSLFNLDAMTMACQILSDKENDLWSFETADGRSIKRAIDFLYPYVKTKQLWPYHKDVMYWDSWPVAHPFLIMAANHFTNIEWFTTWKLLDHSPAVDEVLRNLPVRNPIIWLAN